MIQTLVATLMWALVASLLIFRRKRTDRSITYAAITIAIAMTLNVDGIYAVVDPRLGGTNIATLIADALLMTGLFFLGRGVMKSGEYRPRLVRAAVSAPVLLIALLAITASFLFIDRGTTTTRFMSDLGAQPATAVYSIINFSYGALVIATMLVLAARQYRHSTGIQRLPAALLSLGSTFGVALCLAVIVMDIAGPDDPKAPRYYVNPEIVWASEETAPYEEGCLSIPDIYDEVERPARVKLKYLNYQGEEVVEDAEGLFAVCIQHEMDHLEGVLFIDHLSRLKRERAVAKVKKQSRAA